MGEKKTQRKHVFEHKTLCVLNRVFSESLRRDGPRDPVALGHWGTVALWHGGTVAQVRPPHDRSSMTSLLLNSAVGSSTLRGKKKHNFSIDFNTKRLMFRTMFFP